MKYLIPFDFSSVSEHAVVQAQKLAAKTDGTLLLVHFISDEAERAEKETKFKQYIASLQPEYKCDFLVEKGHVFDDIGKVAETAESDYVVMGTHGVNLRQRMFGSNAIKVISNCNIPFLVFQEGADFHGITKIVMPISIESKSMQVLRYAAALGKIYNAEIHLVGRLHSDEFLKRKENANVLVISRFLKDAGVSYHFEIVDKDRKEFEDYILAYAKEVQADLIAATYYSDAILTVFEKFVQNLIVNDEQIPVLSLNAQSLSRASSSLSFMTA